jgi:hypothetical protein
MSNITELKIKYYRGTYWWVFTFVIPILAFQGCGFRCEAVGAGHSMPPYIDHPNFGQKCSSFTGGLVGGIIAIPITIITLPFTYPYGGVPDEEKAKADSYISPICVPGALCIVGGGYLFGSLTWPLFGWWHLSDDHNEKEIFIGPVVDSKSSP